MKTLLPYLFCILFFTAKAQLDTTFWTTDGQVNTVERVGNTLYLGGFFDYLGPITGCLVPIQLSTENILTNYTQINGTVRKIISDNNGGFFICGNFTVPGYPAINNVAHIFSNYTIDPAFSVDVKKDVYAILLYGNKLYIGGKFQYIGTTKRILAAALDPANGALLSWDANIDSLNGIYCNALAAYASQVYVGGRFDKVGGTTRYHLVEVDTLTGAKSTFYANPGINGYINCLKTSNDTLYVAGNFTGMFGNTRRYLTYFNLTNHSLGALTTSLSNSVTNPTIYDFEIVGNTIYIAGYFDGAGSNPHNGIARINLTGTVDNSWSPATTNMINNCVKYYDGNIYTSGTTSGSASPFCITDTINGTIIPTNVKASNSLYDIFFTGDTAYFGGAVNTYGANNLAGVYRHNIAAINTLTNLPNGFAPAVDGGINDMKFVNGKLVIIGGFNTVGGLPRSRVASVDPYTGIPDSWSPSAAGTRRAFVNKDLLYLCGDFDTVNNVVQKGITAFDTLTFNHIPQNISVTSGGGIKAVMHLHFWDDKIFMAGKFDSINGLPRRDVACYNMLTQSVAAFEVGLNAFNSYYPQGTLHHNNKLFVYGAFQEMGDSVRYNLAELDTATGKATAWNPDFYPVGGGVINDIVVYHDSLLCGGSVRIYGPPTYDDPVALVDPVTGNFSYWNDSLTSSGFISRFCLYGDRLYAGGVFTRMNKQYRTNLASWIVDPQPPIDYKQLKGNIFQDLSVDCIKDINEKGLGSMIVKAEPGSQYSGTDNKGDYLFNVADTGTYTISQIKRTSLFNITQFCPVSNGNLTAIVDTTTSTVEDLDFADSIKTCHLLYLNGASTRRRVCQKSYTTISYCNVGIQDATNAEIKLIYPENVFSLTSIPPWTSKQDSLITYSLGTIAAGQCGAITILDSVACIANVIGLTECVRAAITPGNNCIIANTLWDNSDITLEATCNAPSALVTIKNSGAGNMNDSSTMHVYFDSLLVYESKFKLNSADSAVVTIPASGQTIRLEADNTPYNPSLQSPSITVEGCNAGLPVNIHKGFVNQFNDDDDNPSTSITCSPLLNGFDPNEKLAIPEGVTGAHLIKPNTEIEYILHFQNTGNDTAYQIMLRDTLDANIDLATFTEGASSHPYKWYVSGSQRPVLTFYFENINLPDSSTNLLESEGFVQFSVKPNSSAPLGTVINNKVGIYFDFNPAIVTNETFHTISNTFPTDYNLGVGITITTYVGINEASQTKKQLIFQPNPVVDCATAYYNDFNLTPLTLEIKNALGLTVQQQILSSAKQQFCFTGFPSGVYYYQLRNSSSVLLSSGKIIRM